VGKHRIGTDARNQVESPLLKALYDSYHFLWHDREPNLPYGVLDEYYYHLYHIQEHTMITKEW